MAHPLRREVLKAFKTLHKARKDVFRDDPKALNAARLRINEEYKNNKEELNTTSIAELMQFSNAVANELRTNVVQAEKSGPGKYRLRITPETEKLENAPFDPNIEIPKGRPKAGVCFQCGTNTEETNKVKTKKKK